MTVQDSFHKITPYNLEIDRWFIHIESRFRSINNNEDLTPEDKKRLKEYYLEVCVTPRIRETIRIYFPEDFPADQRPGKRD